MRINKKDLLYALQVALRVIPRKSHLPILANILIDGPGQQIVATDLETMAIVPTEILDYARTKKVEGELPEDDYLTDLLKPQLRAIADDFGMVVPGKATAAEIHDAIWAAMRAAADAETGDREFPESYCINAKSLQAIVKTLEDEEVEITLTGEMADLFNGLVSIGENFRNLATVDTEDFPGIPEVETDSEAVIEKNDLSAVLPATLQGNGLPSLGGVYFDSDAGKACSTDGHRLHMMPAIAGKSFILPANVASVMIATVEEDSILLRVSVDGEKVVMDTGKARIIARTIEGDFPDYKMVIPKSSEHHVTMKKSDVTKALAQALLMRSDKYCGAKMTFNGGIDIEVVNPEKGEYQKTNIPLVSGNVEPSIEMAFNLSYLLDVMDVLEKDAEVEVGLKDDVNPLVFTHGEFKAVVMPMRTT